MLVYAGPAPLTMSEAGEAGASAGVGGRAEVAQVAFVSGNYFSLLGGAAARGRAFTPEEDATLGTHPVAVLSHKYWQRRFGGDAQILGKTFTVNGRQLSVVGVAAADFYGVTPLVPDVWVPVAMQNAVLPIFDSRDRGATFFRSVGRLKPDVSAEQARADIEVLAGQLARVLTLACSVLGALGLLLASVGLYGVISYTVAQRTHEIGVRMALGARRRDVLRLVIGGGMRVVLAGVVAGLVGAAALSKVLVGFLYGLSPFDPLAFGGVSLLLAAVALLAMYLPARRAARVDPVIALRHE